MQRGANWYKSDSKSGHGHEPEALTLPTHLEVGVSRLPPSRKVPD